MMGLIIPIDRIKKKKEGKATKEYVEEIPAESMSNEQSYDREFFRFYQRLLEFLGYEDLQISASYDPITQTNIIRATWSEDEEDGQE